MNNKKIQAQMQINVSFLAQPTELVKQLQSAINQVKLSSDFGKTIATDLSKGVKEGLSDINKLTANLSKKGLSNKEYNQTFDTLINKFEQMGNLTKDLRKNVLDFYSSLENKEGLKSLQELQKTLETVQKLSTKQKANQTRKDTTIQKMLDETGIDYNISRRTLLEISKRRKNGQDLTNKQKEWQTNNHLDDAGLKRVLDLFTQIEDKSAKTKANVEELFQLTGDTKFETAIGKLEKQVAQKDKETLSSSELKSILPQITAAEEAGVKLIDILPTLREQWIPVMSEAEQQAIATAKATSTLKEVFAQFGIHFSAATVVKGFIDLMKSSFEFYKSLDSALNQIYVVSNLSIERVQALQGSFLNMAKTTGMALDDVTRAAVLFYQQGLNTNQVLEMTRVTAQFAKVAGIDATDAANKLTAAVNGYRLSAQDAMSVADKFNKVAASSAADINELSTAFSKAAAQANQAGVSMDNYLAYIATMEEKTREAPENIGTSLKTIFSRMQQIKSGENTDDNTTVNDVEKALRTVNIALRDTNGQLRDLEEIFAELGPKWNTLDRNTQAYLGTIIAGTRQQSRFITLMQNWDRVLDLSEQSANSAGQQALMHAKAMDSITSRLQQLKVAWQEFVSNIASSSLFKGAIQGLTSIVNLLNSGTKPMSLLATTVGIIAPKLQQFQKPLVDFFKGNKDKTKAQISQLEGQAFQQHRSQLLYQQELDNGVYKTAKERERVQAEINRLKEEEANTTRRIGELEKQQTKTMGQKLQSLGVGLNMLGTALASVDENLGGITSTAGTAISAIGQVASKNYIGAIITGITAISQGYDLIKNWDKRVQERVANSINDIGEALNKVNNATTQINSADKLIERYNVLTRTIYRTEEEQAELNRIIQELGDTYNVDVLTDAYGNLTINIVEVEEELKKLRIEQNELLEDLKKQEQESLAKGISGLGNNTTLEEFMRQNLMKNRGSYNTLLTGLTSQLVNQAGEKGKQVAQAFSSNLKTALRHEIELNPLFYTSPAEDMLKMQDDINEAFANNEDALTDLYSKINYLKQNVNNMTYAQAQEYLQRYFNKWHDELNLTEEEWNALVNSVNTTVFGNANVLNFIEQVNQIEKETNPAYWDKEIQKQEAFIQKVEEFRDQSWDWVAPAWTYAIPVVREFTFLLRHGSALTETIWEHTEGISEEYDIAVQRLDELLNKQKRYYETYAKEHNLYDKNGNPDLDAAAYEIDALYKLRDGLKKLNSEQMSFFNNLKSVYDFSDLTGVDKINYSEIITTISNEFVRQGAKTNADRFNIMSIIYEQNKDKFSDDIRAKMELILKDAYDKLQVPTPKSLKQIGETLKSFSKDLQSFNTIMADFKEAGTMTLDTFIDLAGLIENLDFNTLANMDPAAVTAYCKAIDNLNLAYDENSGAIKANGASLQTLQDIQQEVTKAKLRNTRDELIASKATIKAELDYIDAQIAATTEAMNLCLDESDLTVTTNDIKQKADDKFTTTFKLDVNERIKGMKSEVDASNKWSTAILINIEKVAHAYGALYEGIAQKSYTNLKAVKAEINNLKDDEDFKWEGSLDTSPIDWEKYGIGNLKPEQRQEIYDELLKYRTGLENLRTEYQTTFEGLEGSIKLLDSLINSDLSKLGTKKETEKKINDYIGKLREVYNILNRIDLLEHRLSMLQSYADIEEEEAYGKHLKERISINNELLNQYDFLVREQKAWTNGFRDFIERSSVADVFAFDEMGQIIVDFEKYNKLSTKATEGQKSQKEIADQLYDTYTSMYSDLEKDVDNYINALKRAIDYQQEMVDAYVDTEHDIADAIQEIYKKILDDRLEAIDKEKKAIDDLEEARRRSRQDQENAKELSGLQTNLQRAMMDTSGASDSAFIKSQQDIGDKLDKIADDKYSEMLDDIQKALDEEKDALQKDFDELFDDQRWLFNWMEANLMNNEDGIVAILSQTKDWRQKTEAEHEEDIDLWNTRFHTYQAGITGKEGKTVTDVIHSIDALQRKTLEIDESLKNINSKEGSEIIAAIQNGINSVNNTIKNNKSTVTYNTYYHPTNDDKKQKPKDVDGADIDPSKKSYNINPEPKYEEGNELGSSSYFVSPWEPDSNGHFVEQTSILKKYVMSGIFGGYDVLQRAYDPVSKKWFYQLKTKPPAWFIEDDLKKYKAGGLAYNTGPAWLDGTSNAPEAVLDALQTKHFIDFTNTLDKMYGNIGQTTTSNASVVIDTISFNVGSMSSVEDGEKAFNMFVDKFKEIGNQTGIQMNNFKNTR